jgi:hypothetical protein
MATIGQIESTTASMDGSPLLIVEANDDSTDAVASISTELARVLGGKFVRATD